MEQIEQLEIRIEELREAIERSRRLMLAGQACGVEDRRGGRTRRSTTAQIAVEGCALAVLISNDLSHSLHSPARARPAGGGLKTVDSRRMQVFSAARALRATGRPTEQLDIGAALGRGFRG